MTFPNKKQEKCKLIQVCTTFWYNLTQKTCPHADLQHLLAGGWFTGYVNSLQTTPYCLPISFRAIKHQDKYKHCPRSHVYGSQWNRLPPRQFCNWIHFVPNNLFNAIVRKGVLAFFDCKITAFFWNLQDLETICCQIMRFFDTTCCQIMWFFDILTNFSDKLFYRVHYLLF